MQDEIPLFPVCGWSIGPILVHDAVTIKFDFLTNLMQPVNEANQGRHYLLASAQAKELVEKIQKALHYLETAEPQLLPSQTH